MKEFVSYFKEAFWENESLQYEDNKLDFQDGRVDIEDLKRFDNQMYSNFFNRSGLIFSIREYKLSARNVQANTTEDGFSIACISSNLTISDDNQKSSEADLIPHSFRDGCKLLALNPKVSMSDWFDFRIAELKAAMKHKPSVICFGELAYPPPIASTQGIVAPDLLYQYGKNRTKFESKALEILSENSLESFTFLGSYHCLSSLYNVGVIFPLGYHSAEFDVATSNEPLNGEGEFFNGSIQVSPPLTYIKRFPARRAGEETRVPTGNTFDIYETSIGRIAILICSDIIDLNQFLFVARRNLGNYREAIDLILVPSWNTSARLQSMCRELSYLANTMVVNVNANDEDENFPNTNFFVCGLDMHQLPTEYVEIERELLKHTTSSNKEASIYNIQIKKNVQKLRDAAMRAYPPQKRGYSGNMQNARK